MTGCSKPPVDGALHAVVICGFVDIFDAGFVDERPRAVPHLDGIAVIPLDITLDLLPIFQHEDHQGLAVDLFLKIKRLSVGALRVRSIRSCLNGRNSGNTSNIAAG